MKWVWGSLLFILILNSSCQSKFRSDLPDVAKVNNDSTWDQQTLEDLTPQPAPTPETEKETPESPENPKPDKPAEPTPVKPDSQTGPSLSPDLVHKGEIIPTVYYKPVVNMSLQVCPPTEKKEILDKEGKVLFQLCEADYNNCLMQGSCLIKRENGDVSINHQSKIGEEERFFIDQSCPYGQGVASSCLDPFFTVAADMDVYNAGDVIYIPALKGLALPNNKLHSGYFIVRDTGGLIKGPHRFDFFSGYIPWASIRNPFHGAKLGDKGTRLDFYIVKGKTAEVILKERNYPQLPK